MSLCVIGLFLAAGRPASADVAVPPFYQAVGALKPDGVLGTVLKSEPVETSIPGAKAWRIAYVSSDVAGAKTISTGLVVAPTGAAPEGGRPVVAWAHGTTGTAQNCGPSQVFDPARELNQYFLVGGNSWTDYGLPSVAEFIAKGYVVVGTDYQGLGGGGKHQYAVASTNGRDVINSIRAVASMQQTGAGKKAAIYGWSQGGGATLAAASLGDYIAAKGTAADGIDIVGLVALAPDDVAAAATSVPTDEATAEALMGGLATTFSDNIFNFSHFVMLMWGSQAAFPGLELTDLFTDEGAKLIDAVVSQKCMHATSDTLSFNIGSDYKTLLRAKPANALAWSQSLLKGSVDPVKPVAPVIIYWGTADTVVPPVMGELYRKQMCGLGGNVTRVQLDGAQTHFSTPGASASLYVPWIEDRMAGKPIADGCKTGG
ncbi:alpha/beta fold hydrolase [Kaistia dalseonensis]|uniref:Pimeloyl-ACP methyl ester carboxylesterase n=1 Tax=Kaistia dalseonensis TaxID=410840 RepID=A0ABU0H404_9HYPH|nr:alpha/beta fold hydrolase [Kaistia dalseonensis]MCX5494173.1 alpha/beta fold hydrolase [Kaistia dalseonensis]MDQ0436752.1 pimeloyl-ACP methyl ester carboxylesterase [Kaistia dalseonensis]